MSSEQKKPITNQISLLKYKDLMRDLINLGVSVKGFPRILETSTMDEIDQAIKYVQSVKEKHQEENAKEFMVNEIMKLPESDRNEMVMEFIAGTLELVEKQKKKVNDLPITITSRIESRPNGLGKIVRTMKLAETMETDTHYPHGIVAGHAASEKITKSIMDRKNIYWNEEQQKVVYPAGTRYNEMETETHLSKLAVGMATLQADTDDEIDMDEISEINSLKAENADLKKTIAEAKTKIETSIGAFQTTKEIILSHVDGGIEEINSLKAENANLRNGNSGVFMTDEMLKEFGEKVGEKTKAKIEDNFVRKSDVDWETEEIKSLKVENAKLKKTIDSTQYVLETAKGASLAGFDQQEIVHTNLLKENADLISELKCISDLTNGLKIPRIMNAISENKELKEANEKLSNQLGDEWDTAKRLQEEVDGLEIYFDQNTDLMSKSIGTLRVEIYDGKGFVELVDMMPRLVPKGRHADIEVVRSARISYGEVLKSIDADNNLIRYLWTHKHTTPFESVSFQIRMRMPIYVARQVMRHRLFSYNEVSYRYQQPKDEFYYPEVRFQDDTNRQMSKDDSDLTEEEKANLENQQGEWRHGTNGISNQLFDDYKSYVDDSGVAREVARTILPQALMTEMLMKGNARTWLHFLKLRMEIGAQKEIRDLANAIALVIEPRIPTTFATFTDCDINNMDLPGSIVIAISNINGSGCINECGELTDPVAFRTMIRSQGIIGKRKITSFIDTLAKLNILHTWTEKDMEIILAKPE
jgi:thymidylate synthase (FAD)